jgi:hypothetical protein
MELAVTLKYIRFSIGGFFPGGIFSIGGFFPGGIFPGEFMPRT